MADGRVLVNVPIKSYQHKENGTFAIRSSHLALTAYGWTEEAAQERFGLLFQRFVEGHRRRGRLPWVLTRSGLHWQWENAEDNPAAIDLDMSHWTDLSEEKEQDMVA